jgi:hypothetical protein
MSNKNEHAKVVEVEQQILSPSLAIIMMDGHDRPRSLSDQVHSFVDCDCDHDRGLGNTATADTSTSTLTPIKSMNMRHFTSRCAVGMVLFVGVLAIVCSLCDTSHFDHLVLHRDLEEAAAAAGREHHQAQAQRFRFLEQSQSDVTADTSTEFEHEHEQLLLFSNQSSHGHEHPHEHQSHRQLHHRGSHMDYSQYSCDHLNLYTSGGADLQGNGKKKLYREHTNRTKQCAYAQSCNDGYGIYAPLVYCNEVISVNMWKWMVTPFVLVWLVVLFRMVGSTAEDFFSPSLETMSLTLGLPPRFAGVTLLALGNGAPDIASTVNAILDDVRQGYLMGLGELAGAGMFISTIVTGIVILYHQDEPDTDTANAVAALSSKKGGNPSNEDTALLSAAEDTTHAHDLNSLAYSTDGEGGEQKKKTQSRRRISAHMILKHHHPNHHPPPPAWWSHARAH